MVLRFLWLGAILLPILLTVPACNDAKPTTARPTASDPLGNEVPKPGGRGS
jgi:hypothetical protein